MRQRQRIRRSRTYSLDALIVADDGDVDDPIAELLLQARERGLPLCVAGDVHHAERSPASQPGAVVGTEGHRGRGGRLGSLTRPRVSIQHRSSRVAEKVGPQTNKPR
jgi:hypothetical protein